MTPAQLQSHIDAGDTTWPDVVHMLRTELHIPDGAIEEWRTGDRDLTAVLVEWVEQPPPSPDRISDRVSVALYGIFPGFDEENGDTAQWGEAK